MFTPRILIVILLALPVALSSQSRATSVILFVADAGGTSTLAAASLHAHGATRRLFVQRMPHLALSDTSTASQIVSDSAAGMTAIVTGEKTHNGVLSQSASAVRGKQDGEALKTILEYAEERGLFTGVISNDSLAGATPAATYAHANERNDTAGIFHQVFSPRYGDGVDVMIGSGRGQIETALAAKGQALADLSRQHGRPILSALSEIAEDDTRAIVLLDSADFDLQEAVDTARRLLSRNPKGYFLMVESDTHTDNVRRGLDRMAALDRVIERTAKSVQSDTLVLFTADHSFDIRLRGGTLARPLLEDLEQAEAAAANTKRRNLATRTIRMDNSHTGEEVLAAAQGPGADAVRGYIDNTDLFRVMMRAFGWMNARHDTPAGAGR
jgi:alkaline phosphatase